MNKNVEVIYKKFDDESKNIGFINLTHRLIKGKSDLAEISQIFRDPRYETFRIIYMNKDKIKGFESISSGTPNVVELFPEIKGSITKRAEIGFYKMKDRMKRLNADSYYLVHNHPSGDSNPSSPDLVTTKKFAERVQGFKGHVVISDDNYSWIDMDGKGKLQVDKCIPITNEKKNKMSEKIKNSINIENIKISSREDITYLMHNIINSKDYSTAILTDAKGHIRVILDVPDTFINMSEEQVNGYFKNMAREEGATRVFFATQNEETYKKSLKHTEYGTFKDNIYYQNKGEKLVVAEASCEDSEDLFSKKISGLKLSFIIPEFREENDDYDEELEEDIEDGLEKEVRIILKRVGLKPEEKIIPNTLEAKQELVHGYIENVYLDDIGVDLICNEEGKLDNMDPNLTLFYDYIAGDCFFIGDDFEHAGYKSLTDEEIEKIKDFIKLREFKYKEDILKDMYEDEYSEKELKELLEGDER